MVASIRARYRVLTLLSILTMTTPSGERAEPLEAPPARATPASRRFHHLDGGVGWQNTGASEPLRWRPAIEGSRKDVPVFVGWGMSSSKRIYWAPFARLKYTSTWSIGGAMNLLGVDLGFGGLGVHLTDPPAPAEKVEGRWFAVFEVNLANLRIGGNLTPNRPRRGSVPDPDAHREMVEELVADGEPSDASVQRYPFGPYAYVEVAFPIQIRAWRQVREDLGVGMFLEATVFGMEWPLDRPVERFAQTYNIMLGPVVVFGTRARGR